MRFCNADLDYLNGCNSESSSINMKISSLAVLKVVKKIQKI